MVGLKNDGSESIERFLRVEEISDLIATYLKEIGFDLISNRVFDREPPPKKIGQVIFGIGGRAAIGRIKVEDASVNWFQLSCLIYAEINAQPVGGKPVFPRGVTVSHIGSGVFRVVYEAAFPARETEDQIVRAINALVRFYNYNSKILRENPFVSPLGIEIVPLKTREARKLANMGALAKPYCLAWLAAQLPDKFSAAQKAEIKSIADSHNWIFKQGEPLSL